MNTVLGIWAHPDDEVFVSGGFMADAVRRGDRVVCLHMTRGEAGLFYRRRTSPEALGPVREAELTRSLARIGVTEQYFLDYADGCLAEVPVAEVVERLLAALVDIDPDTIVTFGEDGFTGHPDHKALAAWVTTAVRIWNRSGAKVLHAVVPSMWKGTLVPRLNEFEFFWPGHPATYSSGDISYRLDDATVEAKVEAIAEHTSQMQPLFDAYGEEFMWSLAAVETFRSGTRSSFRTRMLSDLRRS